MENSFILDEVDRPKVGLIGKPSALSLSVVEILLANYCRVFVFSENINTWEIYCEQLKDNPNLKIQDSSVLKIDKTFDYLIYLDESLGVIEPKRKGKSGEEIKEDFFNNVINEIKSKEIKTLFIFPYVQISYYFNESLLRLVSIANNIKENYGIVFVGTVIGPRMILNNRNYLLKALKEYIFNKKISFPSNPVEYHPIFVGDLAKEIVKNLFSFGYQQKKIALLGGKINTHQFAKLAAKSIKDVHFDFNEKGFIQKMHEVDEKVYIATDIGEAIRTTLKWFENNKEKALVERLVVKRKTKKIKRALIKRKIRERKENLKDIKAQKFRADITKALKANYLSRTFKVLKNKKTGNGTKVIKRRFSQNLKERMNKSVKAVSNPYAKWSFRIFILIFILFILPIFLIITNLMLLYLGQKLVVKGYFNYGSKAFGLTKQISEIAAKQMGYYGRFPVVDDLYQPGTKLALLQGDVAEMGVDIIRISRISAEFAEKMLGNEPYTVSNYTEKLQLELDSFHKRLSFFEADAKEIEGIGAVQIKKYLEESQIEERRQEIFTAKNLLESMPKVLGEDESKTYLILFQNNMELRPTGGFIGSFALVKFEKGRLIDVSVFDVYSADGQLKGHVEPPPPIKAYLDEATWYLRDSNWDPNFLTSSKDAEWFLDKEMEIEVDGVIGIDLEFVKEALGVFGPIKIHDFDREVNKSNLYEIVQYEAEKDFFPGSRKKANFLSALSTDFIEVITKADLEQRFKLAEVIFKSLEKRHVQIALHDEKAKEAINDLNWDGDIRKDECYKKGCYSDLIGVVEANLGVNKANYFVERKHEIVINLREEKVERILKLDIKVNANPVLGRKAKYSSYIRVMAPLESEFQDVKITSKIESETKELEMEYLDDRIEAGVLVEINPGQEKSIVFTWVSDSDLSFRRNGEYKLLVRKQAGIESIPLSLRVVIPGGNKIATKPSFTLTNSGDFIYNTLLSKDNKFKVYW